MANMLQTLIYILGSNVSICIPIPYSCFLEDWEDLSVSTADCCLILSLASARNAASGSCLSEGSFIAMYM